MTQVVWIHGLDKCFGLDKSMCPFVQEKVSGWTRERLGLDKRNNLGLDKRRFRSVWTRESLYLDERQPRFGREKSPGENVLIWTRKSLCLDKRIVGLNKRKLRFEREKAPVWTSDCICFDSTLFQRRTHVYVILVHGCSSLADIGTSQPDKDYTIISNRTDSRHTQNVSSIYLLSL